MVGPIVKEIIATAHCPVPVLIVVFVPSNRNQKHTRCAYYLHKTFVMPESPRWLVSKDRDDEAREVLKMVYPDGFDVDVIVHDIKEGIEKEALAEHAVGW